MGRRILDYNTQSSYLEIWDNFQWDCGTLELLMTRDNGELGGKYASLVSAASEGERGTKRQGLSEGGRRRNSYANREITNDHPFHCKNTNKNVHCDCMIGPLRHY